MNFSIGRKLSVLVGVLLALFLTLGLTAYQGLQQVNTQMQQVLNVEEPTRSVAYEMDVNVLRIVSDVLGYLGDRDPAHVEHIAQSRETFQAFHQEYAKLANSERANALVVEVNRVFRQFEELTQSLVGTDDAEHEALEGLLRLVDQWKSLVEDRIEPVIAAETGRDIAYRKLRAITDLETALNDSQRFLADSVTSNNPEYEQRFTERLRDAEQSLAVYTTLTLSPEEQRAIEQLQPVFQQIVSDSRAVLRLEQQNDGELADFLALRQQLGELLYDGIIQGTASEHLQQSKADVINAVKTANRNILILLGLGVVFGLTFGIFLARNITRPLKQVVDAASSIAVGDLNVTLNVKSRDEVGLLASSFRRMIAYIRHVADVTATMATGDLRVDVVPQSDQDVLNTSLKNMIAYIHDIAEVAEKISNKDLALSVQPCSADDMLNQALQKMVVNLRAMIHEIEQQNWQQQGLNQLSNELLGEESLLELCNKAIRFVARYLNAGYGVLYVYNSEQQNLMLYSSYAFTDRDRVSNRYALGEGVVGQVALEQSPILLKNIRRGEGVITTGTTSQAPRNTYTFPLVYDRELYGVIELAAFEVFTEAQQHFLQETNRIIATGIFSTRQRDRVRELLDASQTARKDAEQAAREAEEAQQEAQQRAKEVEQANVRLQEQRHQLQQQSEELRQVNANLEEQQLQLQRQSEELRQQNEHLNQATAELDQRAQDLELASKYKSEFLANMSHELRTPLNSIILLSKMLSRNDKGNFTEKDVKQASVIHQAGDELLRLINDILDLSKIEAGKVTMHATEFSSSDLLDSFHDLFHSMAEDKGLQFIIQDDYDAKMVTDRDKLSQVIRNLLANAFKFTKQGSITLKIADFRLQIEGTGDDKSQISNLKSQIQIEVIDTGIGIPKDKQRLVFEAFQQADGSTSREFGGTGLGLSIAREYVRLLGGKLVLESEPGQGTTFRVALPIVLPEMAEEDRPNPKLLARPEPVPAPLRRSRSATAPPEPESRDEIGNIEDDRGAIGMSDKTILIIEDNADIAQTTMDVTRKMGFKTLVGLTGQDGLSLAAQYRPTGILLDLVLPDMNGMQILRELKSTRELRHIPVHIMSSKERDNAYRAAGAIGYFQKPVNDLDIQHAIEGLLSVSEKYPKRLLIVEDDTTQREAIQEFLGCDDKDIEFTGVGSQEAAITEIDTGAYDAAIIDLGLHDGSGYDICKYIKLHNLALPVIIYTGRELTEEQERELRKYTDSIIIKTARSYERLSDEVSVFLHQMYHGQSETPPPAPSRALAQDGTLEGTTILVVDDDMKNIFVLASALENNGAAVIDANNGQAALDLLRQRSDIDLVLMDIMMPVMDGYTAIREIRNDPKLKHLPIIALTAKALKGDRQKCIQAGADDYLSKPVDYDGLIRLAKAWIEKE